MDKINRGVKGAVFILSGSIVSAILTVFNSFRNIPHFLAFLLLLSADALFIFGIYTLMESLKEITEKHLMRDTRNKIIYGFYMLILSVVISFLSFISPVLNSIKWVSLSNAFLFFAGSLLLIIALMRIGERFNILHFKIASLMFILLIIFPPYFGGSAVAEGSFSGFVISAMFVLGDAILSIQAILIITGLKRLKASQN